VGDVVSASFNGTRNGKLNEMVKGTIRGSVVAAVAGSLLLVPTLDIGNAAAATPPSSGGRPTLPQLNQLPVLSSIPDLSTLPQLPGLTVGPQNTVTDPATGGVFGAPFVEPGVSCPGETEGASATDPYNANANVPTQGPETNRTAADIACKPAGVSVVDLPTPNGDPSPVNVLYWDGLEGEENIDFNIVAEYGDKAGFDQSRLLQLDTTNPRNSSWVTPNNPTGGAAADGQSQYLFPNAPACSARSSTTRGPAREPCSAATSPCCPTARCSFRAAPTTTPSPRSPGRRTASPSSRGYATRGSTTRPPRPGTSPAR
jgi:hypothetical protein